MNKILESHIIKQIELIFSEIHSLKRKSNLQIDHEFDSVTIYGFDVCGIDIKINDLDKALRAKTVVLETSFLDSSRLRDNDAHIAIIL